VVSFVERCGPVNPTHEAHRSRPVKLTCLEILNNKEMRKPPHDLS
jgi:hypothetical protein